MRPYVFVRKAHSEPVRPCSRTRPRCQGCYIRAPQSGLTNLVDVSRRFHCRAIRIGNGYGNGDGYEWDVHLTERKRYRAP